MYAKKRTRFVYCYWLVYFKADNLLMVGICIAAYSAWVFQGRGGQAAASVNTGPTTARRNVPARGCVRLCQRVFLVVIVKIDNAG